MSKLPACALELLKKIATSEGFIEYTTKVDSGSNHGDNFIGVLSRVTLAGTRKVNGKFKEDKLNLLCKFGSDVAERRKEFNTDALFEREIYAYEKLLPAFKKFQKSRGLVDADCFSAYPKYYGGIADGQRGQFLIVMDDLRYQKFDMWPKNKPIPFDHAKMVFEQLGKYHGVSFAMKDQKPVQFREFQELDDLFGHFYRNALTMFHAAYDMAMSVLDDEEHVKVMQDLKENTLEIFLDCVDEKRFEPFGVITHGDCWNNNQLYKYEKEVNKNPSAISVIDWQIIRYSSPVLDLLYYMFSATDKELRDKEYHNLLHIYHSALTDIVKKLGSNPEKLFSYDDLQAQMKKFGKFSMLMTPVLIQVMMANAEDISNMDDLSQEMDKKGENVGIVKAFTCEKTKKAYQKRIRETITDVLKYELYWN